MDQDARVHRPGPRNPQPPGPAEVRGEFGGVAGIHPPATRHSVQSSEGDPGQKAGPADRTGPETDRPRDVDQTGAGPLPQS